STFAVSQVRGDEQLPLRSYRHYLKRLGPALNDSAYRKRRRPVVFIRTVKLFSANQRPAIITDHRVRGCRFFALPRFQYLVLQAAGQDHDAVFGLVLGQKSLAFFLVLVPELLHLRHLLLAKLVAQVDEGGMDLIIGHASFAASNR